MWGGCNTDNTETLMLHISFISYDYYVIKLRFHEKNKFIIFFCINNNVTSEEQQVTSKCRTKVKVCLILL